MEKENWKSKYIALRKKYQELKKEWNKLKSHYERLKENNEIDLGQIKFLRKENEYLKSKKSQRSNQEKSIIDDHNSHYIVKPISSKVESTGKVTQIVPDQSIYQEAKSPFIYKGFFIIGPKAEPEGLSEAKILYEYFPENCGIDPNMKPLIPQLCFPQEAALERFSCSEDTISSIYSKLQPKRSQKHFIFTLRNEPLISKQNPLPNSDHELLYIICIEIKDFIKIAGCLYRIPKCYCIASFVPAFELHYEILHSLLYLRSIPYQNNPKVSESIDICNDSEILLLECYADCEELRPGQTIQLGIEQSGMIRYRCPLDLSSIDACWTCVPLMSSLSFRDFFWLICALVQEKSIVFMSGNIGLVTSCVLGMTCAIRPFKWPSLMVALIPDSLHELLEAPVPLIAGTVYVSPIMRHSFDNIIWVVLDELNIQARVQCSPQTILEVKEPKRFDRKNEMEAIYNTIKQKKVFDSNEEMNEKCLKVLEIWKEFWNQAIQEHLQNPGSESEFVRTMSDTQMFAYSV